jgi:hypothetical protein
LIFFFHLAAPCSLRVDRLGAFAQTEFAFCFVCANASKNLARLKPPVPRGGFWFLLENILAENSYFGFSFFSGAPRAKASSKAFGSRLLSHTAHAMLF